MATLTLPRRHAVALLLTAWALLFAVRLAAPWNLMDQDQERPTAYIMDVLVNGEWIVQRDQTGAVTSKPPLYTWISALCSLPAGRLTRFTLYLPCALSVLGCMLLMMRFGGRLFGSVCGFFGALIFLLSLPGLKMLALARTDPLFVFTVFLAVVAAWRCWNDGASWVWFWLAATAATMTKGPLGIVLGATGLLATVWDRRGRGDEASVCWRPRQHAAGIALLLAIAGGWFALAYWRLGSALVDKMIGDELVRQAVAGDRGESPFEGIPLPFAYFLSRFLPWSFLACLAAWRVWKQPAADPAERRFERFLTCQVAAGILLFSFAGHKRPDHLFPLLPAAALLAGRELARLRWLAAPGRCLAVAGAAVAMALAFATPYYFLGVGRTKYAIRTAGMAVLAGEIRRAAPNAEITFFNSPYALQYFLGSMRQRATKHQAVRLLTTGFDPVTSRPTGDAPHVYVATRDPESLREALGNAAPHIYSVLRWPAEGPAFAEVFSNKPRLEPAAHSEIMTGPWRIAMRKTHLVQSGPGRLVFRLANGASPRDGRYTVTNDTTATLTVRLHPDLDATPGNQWAIAELPPNASVTVGQGGEETR